MLHNYLIVAIRNLLRHKVLSIINILGLSLGLVGFIYIAIFIHFENSFDEYHAESDLIYRVNLGPLDENQYTYAITPGVMAPILQREYPGIASFARFRRFPSLISFGEKQFYENEFYFTDSSVFEVFEFNFIEGLPNKALTDPNSIVLTSSNATKIFGRDNNLLGEVLRIDNQLNYKVTGIIEDLPPNSHFPIDYLVSISSIPSHHNIPLKTYQITSWYAHYFYTYIRLNPQTDPTELDLQLRDAAKYHSDPENYELYGRNMGIYLQQLSKIHLNPIRGEIKPQGSQTTLYILGAVSAIILLLGSFNYANLTTAQSLKRSKEVGLRKTLGANRGQLIQQFLTESILTTVISLAFALTCIQLTIPIFNNQFETQLGVWEHHNISIIAFAIFTSLCTGVAGGIYPALIISSYKPASTLKGVERTKRGLTFRKSIVLVQFIISMILISSTIVIYKQVSFMRNSELGIDTEHILVIPTNGNSEMIARFPQFKKRIQQLSQVQHSTICELTPGDAFGGIVARFEGMDKNRSFPTTGVSFDYMKTFGLKIISGRDFDSRIASDSIERVIINRTLSSQLGWSPDEAIDKSYDFGGDNETPGRVIGVMEDYHFNSLKSAIFPTVLVISPNFFDKISIRLKAGQTQSDIKDIANVWSEVLPSWPFEYYFADDHFNRQYKTEEKLGGIMLSFATIAMIIGGLGLLGIVLINTRHRLKEVCIRKTLGAGLLNILKILSSEYLLILLVGFLISLPLSHYLMNIWLDNFAYRMASHLEIVLYSPILIVLTALATIFVLSLKSARTNPVDVLRNE